MLIRVFIELIEERNDFGRLFLPSKHVGRIKNPATGVITFSEKQYAEVKRLLKPGDIVLTYTGGHVGDVFIPGRFKHGITYIGSPKQRKAAGLDVEKLPGAAGRGALELPPEFRRGKLDDGKDADVIESVAEGVIFNCLRHLMDTHVSRMVVLRPQFNVRERTEFIDCRWQPQKWFCAHDYFGLWFLG